VDRIERGLRDQADAVPEQAAALGLDKQRALVDGEGGLDAQAEHAMVRRAGDMVIGGQFVRRQPVLPAPAHILPFVEADRAAGGWCRGIGKARAALAAEEAGHDPHSAAIR
jgi:hypothetical protein